MQTTRDLIRRVDPLRGQPAAGPSARAREELAALIGSANPPVARAPRLRGARMGWAMVTAAVAVAAVIGVLAVGAMLGDPSPQQAVDQPYYENAATLEAKSDLIVRATIVSTREQTSNGFSQTVATIAVAKAAKGDVAAGSRVNCSYRTPGSGPEAPTGLSVGQEYVFLLVRFDDGTLSLVNTVQGYYSIVAEKAIATTENPVGLSSETRRALGLR